MQSLVLIEDESMLILRLWTFICSEIDRSEQSFFTGLVNGISEIRRAIVFLDGGVLDPVVDLWDEDDFKEDRTNGEGQRDSKENPPQPWGEEVAIIGDDKHVCNANPVEEKRTAERDGNGVPENLANVGRVEEGSTDPCNESWPPDALHQVCVEPKGRPWGHILD